LENTSELPKIGLQAILKHTIKPYYDTCHKTNATPLRLYRVKNIYYYRGRYKGKLYRISLKTSDIKKAIKLKKILDMLKGDELYKFKQGDYELIFEYDTVEELKQILEVTQLNQEQISSQVSRYLETNRMMESTVANPPDTQGLRFAELEIRFIEAKRKAGKVGESTYKAYASTFSKLNEYFKKTYIDTLSIEDFEDFRDFLRDEHGLKNKTINGHITYVNKFLDFAVTRKLLKENPINGIESLKEERVEKENYTNKEVRDILSYTFNEPVKTFITIAAYSGMRLNEIHNLTNESLKCSDTGIYYFDIKKSKSKAGIRKVPIHKEILEKILETDFPLFKNKTSNAVQKIMSRELSKLIDKNSTKTFHTFRAKFIENAVNKNSDKVLLVQEIVGHSKSDKDKLTLDTYAKGFNIELKKEVVDSVSYE